jgi:predicted lipoprotein with Yx(FWY)xxD motif
MKRTATAATCAAAVMLAAALTGCSGSSAKSAAGPSATGSSTAAAGHAADVAGTAAKITPATVGTKNAGKLGTILVDGKGRTLYLFVADTKNKSTCTGGCAVAWPPLLSKGTATAGKGADKKLLGTTDRAGGVKEVTYNGHPLYYYVGDSKPGQISGQGLNQFGALWYVVDAKGKQVTR